MINIEYTDTFQGEANYSWVHRYHCKAKGLSDRKLVRLAKRAAGLVGIRCKVEDHGDLIVVKPQGMCRIIFITFNNWQTDDEIAINWPIEVDAKGERS